MNERDLTRLGDMLDHARLALEFVQGRTLADLEEDTQLAFALARAIEVVGEAATHVTPTTRERLPNLDWHGMIGMRHRIVHDYIRIDRKIIWDVTQYDLPPLIDNLREILGE